MVKPMRDDYNEPIIALMAFDDEVGAWLTVNLQIKHFDEQCRPLVKKISAWRRRNKGRAPGNHIKTIIADLREEHPQDKEVYDYIVEVLDHWRDSEQLRIFKENYVPKVGRFIQESSFRIGFQKALILFGQKDLDEAQSVMMKALTTNHKVFDRGQKLEDHVFVRPSNRPHNELFPTGIEILDKHRLVPARKELWMLVASAKKGKSQGMVHLGRQAMVEAHLNVCHITLEMGVDVVLDRYYQALWGFVTEEETVRYTILEKDEYGKFKDFHRNKEKKIFLDSDKAERIIRRKLKEIGGRLPLVVKQFPTKQLTVDHLQSWLDELEIQDHYRPDVLIVDYPDLMKMSGKSENYRLDLRTNLEGLRGVCVDRGIAGIVASQTNRAAANKEHVRESDLGEDFSKVQTCDTIVFYSQTEKERLVQMARLFPIARNAKDRFEFLITQCYDTCKFCLDSAFIDEDCYPPRMGYDDAGDEHIDATERAEIATGIIERSQKKEQKKAHKKKKGEMTKVNGRYQEFDKFKGTNHE